MSNMEKNEKFIEGICDHFYKKIKEFSPLVSEKVVSQVQLKFILPITLDIDIQKKRHSFIEHESKRRNFIFYGIQEREEETFETLKEEVLHLLNQLMQCNVKLMKEPTEVKVQVYLYPQIAHVSLHLGT